jgi:hypothetical protein
LRCSPFAEVPSAFLIFAHFSVAAEEPLFNMSGEAAIMPPDAELELRRLA